MNSKDVNVILKKNGEVFKNVVDYKFNKGVYLNYKDDCYVNYIDYSDSIEKEQELDEICVSIKKMFLALGYEKVNPVFEVMMIENNFNNIIPLINNLLVSYNELCNSNGKLPVEIADYVDESNYELMMKTLRNKPNVFYRIIVKSIIKYHYASKIGKMHSYDFKKLYNYFLINGTVYELFKMLNEPFYSIANDGLPKVALAIMSTELEMLSDKIYGHLCWDVCPVNTCVSCPKVMDRKKKSIDEYDFIVSGYQSTLGNGKMVVTDCKRLTLQKPNKL